MFWFSVEVFGDVALEIRSYFLQRVYMCSPAAYWGDRPRESYVIRRELVRLEICKRGAAIETVLGEKSC